MVQRNPIRDYKRKKKTPDNVSTFAKLSDIFEIRGPAPRFSALNMYKLLLPWG